MNYNITLNNGRLQAVNESEAIDFRPEDYSFNEGRLLISNSGNRKIIIGKNIKEGETYPVPDGFDIEIEYCFQGSYNNEPKWFKITKEVFDSLKEGVCTLITKQTARLVPIKEQKKEEKQPERFYKLTMRWGGEEKDLSVDYYNDLTEMVDEVFHFGVTGLPVIEKCEEVSKDEYEEKHLPI